jgi:acetyl-CoA carboxylase carboxyl transferase subunit beta
MTAMAKAGPLARVGERKVEIPKGLWTKCESCKEIVYKADVERNSHVCPRCQHHFRIGAREWLRLLVDPDSFRETDAGLRPSDPLGFKDSKRYPDRLKAAREATGLEDAVLTGTGTIGGYPVVIGIMEFFFLGGSMGSVVGEKITRAIERATATRCPLILLSCTGGARMQESVLSLMQMAKTSAALARLRNAAVPYLSILADPTTGGVTASYAMLGDIHIAEPNALIGFAGPRVIQDTIRQELPPGFQRAEFLEAHGFVDLIVDRRKMRDMLIRLLAYFADARRTRGA